MEAYTTDEERVEELKRWWKENGKSLITGVILGLGLLFGWQSWINYNNNIAEQASAAYTQMLSAVQRGNTEQVQALAGQLVSQFSGSPYAVLASLSVAKIKMDQEDLPSAQVQLQWALDNATSQDIQHIARLRLARVMLAQGKIEEAETLVSVNDKVGFESSYQELQGDIFLKQGENKMAHDAYQAALGSLALDSQNRMLLQMKLDSLETVAVKDSNS